MAEQTLVKVGNRPCGLREAVAVPRVDVFEEADGFTVVADVPGVTPEGVEVSFENGELTVEARRSPRQAGRLVHQENETARFHRTFRLNDTIAADKIEASLAHGVLTVTLPKVEGVKARKVTVRG